MDNSFTKQEWDACIKVLKILSRNPEMSLDTDVLKGLVTKLHRRAKKNNKQNLVEQKAKDIIVSAQFLPIQKIQKIYQAQDLLKQYDKFIQTQTILHQSYLHHNYETGQEGNTIPDLQNFQKCYICKTEYKKVHFFYHLLCPACADINYAKRQQSISLTGRVALVTGGRIKIGYLTALKMLRDGATVWVTTRFAKDCAVRFGKEPDHVQWASRLKIVSLDFRNINDINAFLQFLKTQEAHLDILVNNAAQTIRRPSGFYKHLVDFENNGLQSVPSIMQKCIILHQQAKLLPHSIDKSISFDESNIYFPLGVYDKHKQQLDLRPLNSWSLVLKDVTTIEMLETQIINVTAPFMFNSQLKDMLKKSPFERKFIINVSAMEGQFNRSSKTPNHPHTNMAKAALNMMTRTSAQEYAMDNIFMNSVDTGWITEENPFPKKERLYENGFVPPLDETDGMARVYDPIVTGIAKAELPLFGHFLKDFEPHAW